MGAPKFISFWKEMRNISTYYYAWWWWWRRRRTKDVRWLFCVYVLAWRLNFHLKSTWLFFIDVFFFLQEGWSLIGAEPEEKEEGERERESSCSRSTADLFPYNCCQFGLFSRHGVFEESPSPQIYVCVVLLSLYSLYVGLTTSSSSFSGLA